jgi:hypothetical protein
MNNKLCYLLLSLLIVASCKREVDNNGCIALSQNPGWTASDFKAVYTIQLPAKYSGAGRMIGFEGSTYEKVRADSAVYLSYAYCNALGCPEFGDTLTEPFPGSVNVTDHTGTITLDQKKTFCNGNTQGVLYYNHESDSRARLYWKVDGVFRQALEISYDHSRFEEVLDIVKTIKEK